MFDNLKITHELEGGEAFSSVQGLEEAEIIMQDSFSSADSPAGHARLTLAERVTRRLIGTKQTKLHGVDDASFLIISNQVRRFIEADLPIALTTATGSKKDKARSPEESIPDVSELMSLSTLHAMHSSVRSVYSPGIRVQVIREDYSDKFLYEHDPEQALHVDIYRQQLDTLVSAIACLKNVVFQVDESVLMQRDGILSMQQFTEKVKKYEHLFTEYLLESDDMFEGDWVNLASYKALVDEGWLGIIPQEMRDFYYERASLIYSTQEKDRWVNNLARMFASVLLRKKIGYLGDVTTIHDDYREIPDASPVRVSFAAATPGMPTKGGRIFLRTMPLKICSKGIPPWCGDGVMVERPAHSKKYFPGIRNRNTPLSEGMERIPGHMIIEGEVRAKIDAALLRDI